MFLEAKYTKIGPVYSGGGGGGMPVPVASGVVPPNGVVVGSPGDLYIETAPDGQARLWTKRSGIATNMGWQSNAPNSANFRTYSAGASTTFDFATDGIVVLLTSAANRDCALPAANSVQAGDFAIIKRSSAAFNATVTPAGADTIDGTAGVFDFNAIIGAQPATLVLASDAVSNWYRI